MIHKHITSKYIQQYSFRRNVKSIQSIGDEKNSNSLKQSFWMMPTIGYRTCQRQAEAYPSDLYPPKIAMHRISKGNLSD